MSRPIALTDAEAARIYGQVRRLTNGCHVFGPGYSPDPQTFFRGRDRSVRRVLWEAVHGAVPEGRQVRAHCRTKGCVALAHGYTLSPTPGRRRRVVTIAG